MFDNGMWQMPMFLLVASVFNIAFLVVAAKDAWRAHDGDTPQRHDGRIALLTMAVAELVWVLPCFVQCFLVWAGGNGHWWSPHDGLGCDIQGFYSLFSSLAGMMCAAQMAFATFCFVSTSPPKFRAATASCVLMAVGFIVSLLALLSAGGYKYSGEGFCYADWHSTFAVILMDLVLVPSTVVVIVSYVAVMKSAHYSAALPHKGVWALFGGYFLLSWSLWYIGSVISFTDSVS